MRQSLENTIYFKVIACRSLPRLREERNRHCYPTISMPKQLKMLHFFILTGGRRQEDVPKPIDGDSRDRIVPPQGVGELALAAADHSAEPRLR
jgi:hypothetical protein